MSRTARAIMIALTIMLSAASCPSANPQPSPCNLGEHCLQTDIVPTPSITPAT
jgi:hypothetical protein